ncbi:TonB-dependent receptor [Gimibacter soli]|uniref:TonB-dependent receptor n=1 Tax=Gimibacter soli TaxID=3024400 RepID=A0AAE9XSK5_9PROT|nr:TonB-dependent receptor [Gimibacter soli]WCL53285.1 TonB-dependent receptor [Gimibacter soli]
MNALLCSCLTLTLAPAATVMAQEAADANAAASSATGRGSVSGRVLDAGSNLGFRGAIVKVQELGMQATTGADGDFRLRDLPAGTYTLEVSYIGAETATQTVTVSAGQTVSTNVALSSAVGEFEEIMVVGQKARALNALNLKRSAAVVSDSITSDSMGQFPDQNVSEAARRIAGVSVVNDQGEGRFVTIRGADPNLNAVSIGGIRMPSAETDARQVSLDVVASELLSGITVKKTVTPDMDGDAVGGTVEVKTFNAFDRADTFVSATVEGSYNDLMNKLSPKAALSASKRFKVGDENELGIAVAGNYFDRKFGSDNAENGEGWDTAEFGGQEFYIPIEVSQRPYRITRERVGLVGNIDYRIADHSEVYLHTIYSRFSDTEGRSANDFEFDDPEFTSLSATSALANNGSYELGKSTKDRTETQSVMSLNLGAKHMTDAWTVDYQAAYSKSKDNYSNLESAWEGDFDDDLSVGYQLSDKNPKVMQIIASDMDAIANMGAYELDEFALEASDYAQRQWTFAGNFQYDFTAGDVPAFIKFGAKSTRNKKTADETNTVYDDFDEDYTLAHDNLSTTLDYSLANVGPFANIPGIRSFFDANNGSFGINDEDTYIDSNAADFEIRENVTAGYVMGQADFDPLLIVAGVRVEHTKFSADGHLLSVNEDDETLEISPVSASKSYTDYFPSLNLKYSAGDAVIIRAAASRTIARPNYNDVAPIYESAIEEGELEGSFGNPDLDPYSSKNFDLSLEYYPGDLTMISFAAFYKDIKNFIVTADLGGVPGQYEDFNVAITKINGETATLKGFEVSLQQQFSFLPAPFDGMLANVNYTYADGKAHLDLGDRDMPLPNQAKHIFNASLGYEKDRLGFRFAVAYKGKYLAEILDPEDPAFDNYVDAHISYDFTADYEITDNVKLAFKIQNINGRPFHSYFANKRFPGQYEDYGWTGSFGITAKY